jgi:hypothetical protein
MPYSFPHPPAPIDKTKTGRVLGDSSEFTKVKKVTAIAFDIANQGGTVKSSISNSRSSPGFDYIISNKIGNDIIPDILSKITKAKAAYLLVFVAGGVGGNTLAYSNNGADWTVSPSSNSVFTSVVRALLYVSSSNLWIAGGYGGNTLAYSTDGINWTPGTNLFSAGCYSLAYSPSLNIYLAGGNGITNLLGFSNDGKTWTGEDGTGSGGNYTGNGNAIITTTGYVNTIAWSNSLNLFLAGGRTNNTGTGGIIASSADGKTWISENGGGNGNGNSMFPSICYAIVAHPSSNLIVAGGSYATAGNTLAYSTDGKTWTGLGTTIFTINCTALAYSPTLNIWVAGGNGGSQLGYATDPTTVGGPTGWTATGSGIFSSACNTITWSPSLGLFVAAGIGGTNYFATSPDGKNWTALGKGQFTSGVYAVASSS